MEAEATKRFCENCGKELKGRSDQKFCDDSCRNTFNHKAKLPDNEVMNPVINILKKNRSVLAGIYAGNNRTQSKIQMVGLGFNFDYCTNSRTLQGEQYYFCFDFGYQKLMDDQYEIISHDYFDFIYAHYVQVLPDIPLPDFDNPPDVEFYEMLREPLKLNSEKKDPPETRKKSEFKFRTG